MITYKLLIFILLCLVFNFDLKSNIINNYFNFNDSLDSLQDSLIVKDKLPIDTNSTKNIDSLIDNRKSKNGLDTILTYTAKDTVVYSFKKRKMSMQGEVKIDYQNRNLNSETVDVDFIDNTFYANPKYDSLNKKYIGIPKFSEMGEAYAGAAIKYNYKTNRGLISKGETELGEGFYYGESIKRINETDFFIKNGYYTTCDDPDPHYYFGSSKMKMVANDQIYLDPLVFYVEDFPIFAVPFGLFFPTKSGRRSGLIVPSFFFSRDRGIVFENFGFYWAASDYYDMQLTSNIYTKGGYVLKNTHRWNLTDQYSGNANLEYGYTRFNPDSEYSQVWRFILSHNQTINPQERLNINLNLSSSDYNRNTSTNLRERIQQNITSNASYFINFDNQTSLSVSYNREQNIITDEYRQTLPITYNIPNIRLAKIMENDLNFSMRSSANYSNNKVQNIASNT
ncbi:MAG: LPS-assembly protein LptD, partial [Candidatus Kapaibacteriota bacterium]